MKIPHSILGIKLTHDAAVALIIDRELIFSVELEKVDDGDRYTICHDWSEVKDVLATFDLTLDHIETIVIDGWKYGRIIGTAYASCEMSVAPYHEFDHEEPHTECHRPLAFAHCVQGKLDMSHPLEPTETWDYISYTHMAGHIIGAYVTSPFAARKEAAAVLSWDGGQDPRIHIVAPGAGAVYIGSLFPYYGIIYGIMGYYFGPYKDRRIINLPNNPAVDGEELFGTYELPGKLMAYIAKGLRHAGLRDKIMKFHLRMAPSLKYRQDGFNEHELMRYVHWQANQIPGLSDADILCTIHEALEALLVRECKRLVPEGMPLCFAGGSALNIKWNSALRASGHFSAVWVPPFPNDSGSALGAAAAHMFFNGRNTQLQWDVYSGPRLETNPCPKGWTESRLRPDKLGELMANYPREAVVVLIDRAELGPRALGHRSIMMSPLFDENRELLNRLKKREDFRPVAPICSESRAPDIFDPGSPDPYMLFDHQVRDKWRPVIRAVVHLDGSARLQTVSSRQCPIVAAILAGHNNISGIPVLCNTSANFSGKGFFPSTNSAIIWAEEYGVKYVWADGILFSKLMDIPGNPIVPMPESGPDYVS